MSGKSNEETAEITRRDFLKGSGIVLGGVTLVSLGIASSCGSFK